MISHFETGNFNGLLTRFRARLRTGVCIALTGLVLMHTALAQPACTLEQEPNNAPTGAARVNGAFCLKGAMHGKDQDMVAWTVSRKDSAHPWQVRLAGIPGAVTRFDIFTVKFTKDGSGVKDYKDLYSLSSRGNGHARTDTVMLRPGTYYLGLSHVSGGGHYRLRLAPAKTAEAMHREEEPNDSDKQAQAVTGAFAIAGDTKGSRDRYRWTLSQQDAGKHWRLTLNSPVDNGAWIKLYDAKGHKLGERDSRDGDHGTVIFDTLGLPAGTYTVRLGPDRDAYTPYRLRAVATDTRLASQEDEPDDATAQATRDMMKPREWQGSLGPDDPKDFYRFVVPKSWQSKRVHIALHPVNYRHGYGLYLRDAKHQLAGTKGKGQLTLDDLSLQPGAYWIKVSGSPGPYSVRLAARAAGPFDEGEPNDSDEHARAFKKVARGRFEKLDGGDTDVWEFTTQGPARLWTLHAAGDHIGSLTYHGGVWYNAGAKGGAGGASVGPLLLAPGKHYITITGSSGRYVLTRRALGKPDPSMEVEPNNGDKTAQPLEPARPIDAVLLPHDSDFYRFSLPAKTHLRLGVDVLGDDGSFGILLYHAEGDRNLVKRSYGPGESFKYEGVLPAGDYTVECYDLDGSTSQHYRIQLKRLDPFNLPADREPNDIYSYASPLPPDRRLIGGTPGGGNDYYRLPVPAQPMHLQIKALPGHSVPHTELHDAGDHKLDLKWDGGAKVYTATVKAHQQTLLVLPESQYHLQVKLDPDPAPPPPAGTLKVAASAKLNSERVAAFRSDAQWIKGTLHLRNNGKAPTALHLHARVTARSGYRGAIGWRVHFSKQSVNLPAGGEHSVPFRVEVAPDSFTQKAALITLAGVDSGSHAATTRISVSVTPDAPPASPHPWDPLPAKLMGGIDVSRPVFGAKLLDASNPRLKTKDSRKHWTKIDSILHDDIIADISVDWDKSTAEFETPKKWQDLPFTVRLAGDKPVPVAGVILTPALFLGTSRWPAKFALDVSMDGKQWHTVLKDRMSTALHEQGFPLAEPVQARYARLRLFANHYAYYARWRRKFVLSDWKVVAKPGFDPSGGRGLNLATPPPADTWSAPIP